MAIDFTDNDYLGLATHPLVKRSAIEAVRVYGCSPGGTRVGHSLAPVYDRLEHELATLYGAEAALVFSSGYTACLAAFEAFAGSEGVAFVDEEAHPSLHTAAGLAGLSLVYYCQKDLDNLQWQLDNLSKEAPALVATDGVFSLSGDLAPLPQLMKLCRSRGAVLLIDDSHGIGTVGLRGGGTLALFGLPYEPDIVVVGSLGKAIGSTGGYATGNRCFISRCLEQSKLVSFSTTLAPASAAAALRSLQLMMSMDKEREAIYRLAQYLHEGLVRIGLHCGGHPRVPIVSLYCPTRSVADWVVCKLAQKGIWVKCFGPPHVKNLTPRLRFVVTKTHTRRDVEYTLDVLDGLAAGWPK